MVYMDAMWHITSNIKLSYFKNMAISFKSSLFLMLYTFQKYMLNNSLVALNFKPWVPGFLAGSIPNFSGSAPNQPDSKLMSRLCSHCSAGFPKPAISYINDPILPELYMEPLCL
ncbi:hypothetical protein DSO57_1017105 [Entomophthora muscae]|uniref:Uncharacterized protein n=1 Tax=Entomophthora muscae TaxID=34485 RepID=A0ACC2UDG7_9FUNG|nr:hypothetical protein DSO57_1017105 [Entomophthora muscae]